MNNKQRIINWANNVAKDRHKFIEKNKYYYNDLEKLFKFNVEENSSVLEIGCGDGYLLDLLKPKRGVGLDISPEMIRIAKAKYPQYDFIEIDAENLSLKDKFDYVVISDTLGYLEDIQKCFSEIKKVINSDTRIIITYHNFLWQPVLKLAEYIGLKMPQERLNWLNEDDIKNLLDLEGFEIIKAGKRFLIPKKIPFISDFLNKYFAFLPLFKYFCVTGFIICRHENIVQKDSSISIIVPARNEKGNIEEIVKNMPVFKGGSEIIFVEGHSTDETLEEIDRVYKKYKNQIKLKYFTQDGKGKADAVRKGFDNATGDILLIYDADMTVPHEDLVKFYDAIRNGKGEFINGTRLIYPMEQEAMRTLNMIGNKFFSIMFSWLLDEKITDTLCGTKVLSKQNYERIKKNRKYFGDFDPFGDFDLLFGAAKLNLKIVEVPVRYKARTYGDTNISRFTHGWLLLKMVVFAMNKLKFV